MKNNLKEKTKLRCNDSPREEDIGKFFEFENIIDKEKVRKKMKQSTRQGKSDKAPVWFEEYAKKQERFNEHILIEIKEIKKDVSDIKKDVCVLKEKVTVLEKDVSGLKKDVHDIKEDIDNIVKNNNLKR
ncbi:MAG: hypothetical protein Ta2E_04160 [Mycoplasmoidaceae bacterium]|nr:MAG: hypothetical protein Ta2E_04160 [Mycoplasmoidaceae bacterium]